MNLSNIYLTLLLILFCTQTTQPFFLKRMIVPALSCYAGIIWHQIHIFNNISIFNKQVVAQKEYLNDKNKLHAMSLHDSNEDQEQAFNALEEKPYFKDLPGYLWLNYKTLKTIYGLKHYCQTNEYLQAIFGKKE